ncbi:7454_t:CDS:2 [Paraglomus occultum]|uniref:7454_t:CDS:1 n=1 Tax=Paraglomus occultum TaxID=144539 RepID=A0A9N8ZBZ2_9GLOM|nr:7454_t:CDS:2 [Paraglomus occultum]
MDRPPAKVEHNHSQRGSISDDAISVAQTPPYLSMLSVDWLWAYGVLYPRQATSGTPTFRGHSPHGYDKK